ncbi:uncharacterized protein LOC108743335 [Agrilus planipennis]|uniref:Uncharacterized protein LOC108743335 n=1 Tax=Agrilus planipennis TaxID=224129 RepID=A0A7F5RC02_AGRPL|nr:uncharacterized protein LOC108743335 [Agrilus planipennis]
MGDQKGYEQYGAFIGYIGGAQFPAETPLHVPGFRKRYYGTSDTYCLDRDICLYVTARDGTLFCIGAKRFKWGCKNLRYGTVYFGNGNLFAIKENDIFLEYQGADEIVPKTLTAHFSVDGKDLKCVIHINPKTIIQFENKFQDGWIRKQGLANCVVNGEDAKGIISFWYQTQNSEDKVRIQTIVKPSHSKNYLPPENFVLPFTDPLSTKIALTGGKGASLSLLTAIQTNDFIVPAGFVILSNALNKLLEENKNIKRALEQLEHACFGKSDRNIGDCCEEVTSLLAKEPVPRDIANEIIKNLNLPSKNGTPEVKWAVRSSGTIEDSEEFSTAGQNATYLGCQTEEEILEAVPRCWASLFTFQSVHYRRNHGLPIVTDMAVIVQKMVPSDTSGVIFTCHPSTSDMSQMVITSNYGLGESVVSGQADPDTYILSKTWDDKISILSKQKGSKKVKVVMAHKGTKVTEIDPESEEEWSLSSEQALTLGKVGLHIEKTFGSPRDIEWSFCEGQLYILQSRPVTTLNSWTDFELTHEYDTPVVGPDFAYTKANVGEVKPGAETVLSHDLVTTTINNSFTNLNKVKAKAIITSHHNCLMDIINTLLSRTEEDISMGVRACELAVFGHYAINEKMHNMAKKIFGTKKTYQLIPEMLTLFKNTDATVAETEQIAKNLEIIIDNNDSCETILKKIKEALKIIETVTDRYCHISRVNVFYQAIVFSVLTNNKTDINDEVFQDIVLILSISANIISATIPKQLELIAKTIKKENISEEFVNIDPKLGLEWLGNKSPTVKSLLSNFLDIHGHRVYKEFELAERSWKEDPSRLISMIQANCRKQTTHEKTKENLTVDETLNKLQTLKSYPKRIILKYFINKCIKSMLDREKTKCDVIMVIDKLKRAIRTLSTRMVRNGHLPHDHLIFHLSLYEIEKIIKKENIALVAKATRRKKLYPQWNDLKFPEIVWGVPEPLKKKSLLELLSSHREGVSVKGTPVYPGDAVARACVIKSIDNIDHLKNGDILITYSTDIGWSPYFPMLSGIVTEIGGLISHGAVVAREYGLPCIVGVENATEMFKTGDKILLSGKEGIISLLNDSNNTE